MCIWKHLLDSTGHLRSEKNMTIKLEKKEIFFTLFGLVALMFWFLIARNFIASYLQMLPTFIAMLLYNVGLLIGLYFLAYPLNGHKTRWAFSLITVMVILGLNIISAPYLVNADGTINTTVDFWFVSADAGFASLWALFLPQTWIWFMTYIITPGILLLLIPALVMAPKQIAKLFTH